MPCETVVVNGQTIIVCGRGRPVKIATCVSCGAPAPFLCDFEVSPGKTCDATICGRCRINMGVRDYCPDHASRATRLV